MRFLIVVLVMCTTAAMAQTAKAPAGLRWIQLPNPQIEVDGLPWYSENDGNLYRLPERLKDTYPKAVWKLAQDPSGGRLRFRTNSSVLAIRLEYPSPPNMANMQSFGQSGVDLYVGNNYWGTAIADKQARPGKIYEHVYFNFTGQPRTERAITLYLPLYMGVKVLGIGIDAGSTLNRPAPFLLPKPVVFYGTSITQGCCASRPGISYEAKIGRKLNLNFVDLGFSGAGKYEPSLAHAISKIDASCYILDGSNFIRGEQLRKVLGPFIKIIRAAHPDTPILVASQIYYPLILTSTRQRIGNKSLQRVTRDTVAEMIAKGDHHIEFVEGTDLLGPLQGDDSTDGVHPNDLGNQRIATGYMRRIAAVLNLGSTVSAP